MKPLSRYPMVAAVTNDRTKEWSFFAWFYSMANAIDYCETLKGYYEPRAIIISNERGELIDVHNGKQ